MSDESKRALRHLMMVLQYDGTNYVGWETQNNGLAVQQVVEEALLRITREQVTLHGSGRTDAGVHAVGQVASFSLRNPIHPRKLLCGVNAVMPEDVAIIAVKDVPEAFHARFSAKRKRYRYTVLNSGARRPLTQRIAYHVPVPLDIAAMRRALASVVGTHDFTAFAREAHRKKSCVRTLLEAELTEERPYLHFDFCGTGFLYNMIRILVGTFIEVGQNKRSAESVADLLASRPREEAGYTVPPTGLVLRSVEYDGADEFEGARGSDPTS